MLVIRFSMVCLGLSILVGCVGDTPTTPTPDAGHPAGEEGGNCYPDNTCNKDKALACLSGLCVRLPDAGTDGATPDASANDGGTEASGDGSVTCPPSYPASGGSVRCSNGTPCAIGSTHCCLGNNTWTCQANTCITPTEVACDDFLDCPGLRCCVTATASVLACPVQFSAFTQSKCASSCASSEIELCAQGDTCGTQGKTCVRGTYLGNDVGVCL